MFFGYSSIPLGPEPPNSVEVQSLFGSPVFPAFVDFLFCLVSTLFVKMGKWVVHSLKRRLLISLLLEVLCTLHIKLWAFVLQTFVMLSSYYSG